MSWCLVKHRDDFVCTKFPQLVSANGDGDGCGSPGGKIGKIVSAYVTAGMARRGAALTDCQSGLRVMGPCLYLSH